MNKQTYHFTRIICDIRDIFQVWKDMTAGELFKLLESSLPNAECKLGTLQFQIDYHPK
jgi:hypothetical protein